MARARRALVAFAAFALALVSIIGAWKWITSPDADGLGKEAKAWLWAALSVVCGLLAAFAFWVLSPSPLERMVDEVFSDLLPQ